MTGSFPFPPLKYSQSYFTQWLLQDQDSQSTPNPASPPQPKKMELIQLLAINALELTAPVYMSLHEKKKQLTTKSSTELKLEREFIQLSGHPGSFAPAGPNSLWKKMPDDSQQEITIYKKLQESGDPFVNHIPHFISNINYNGSEFIELEDLITRFELKYVNIIDIKLGTRTFLESEVLNTKPRSDLFEKMYKIDEMAPTEEELHSKSVTKLRYMQFREKLSSTSDLGFRIEGVKLSNAQLTVNFQRLKDIDQIRSILYKFFEDFRPKFLQKLKELRGVMECSEFVQRHEMIGSSLLMIRDKRECGCWIIDFAKTFPSDRPIDHREKWQLGNRADGILIGMDNLIRLIE